jgi:histidyl-tRNA synthetase
MREFHQIGAECLGAAEPSADAEVIVMLMRFFEGLGIPRSEMRLLINSMGDDACRPAFRDKVHDYILDHRKTMVSLCEECVRRADTNPLRAFDCKNPNCQMLMAEAPRITDELCEDCKAHYTAVKLLLDCAGLAYEEDPRLVRGLDYYTRTVFEVQVTSGLGSQNAIGGGGRYDKLIQEFGGRPTPGLGFAVGFERILMAQEAAGKRKYRARKPKVFVAAVDESSRIEAFHLAQKMRDEGIPAVLDLQKRSMNSQFRQANKSGMKYVVIIDDSEHNSESVNLKNMTTGEQQSVYKDELIRLLKPKKTNTSDR